jgi:hypothetical protein
MSKTGERSTKDGPWGWFNKQAVAAIRATVKTGYEHALAVYLVLCEAASNQQSEVFTLSVGRCAQLAGVGKKTVRAAIADLTRSRLIKVTRERSADGLTNLPCRFTLLAVKSEPIGSPGVATEARAGASKPALGW